MGKGDSAKESTSAKGSEAGLGSLDLFLLREIFRMIDAGQVLLSLIGDIGIGTGISIKLTSGDG